jgi:hypothetical protein
MDMPPAAVGHNSHGYETQRAAAAARLKFLEMVLRGEVSARFEMVNRAYASDMSDAEFRVFYGYLHHGNRDGCNISVGHARIGAIIGKGEQAVRRTTKALEALGWLPEAERQQRKAATRKAAIPPHAMRAIVAEVVDRSKLTGQPIVVSSVATPQHVDRSNAPDRSNTTGQDVSETTGQEPLTGQTRPFRPVKSDHITIEDKPLGGEEGNARDGTCSPAGMSEPDLIDYHRLFNRWGRKPNDITPGADWPRNYTDPVILGSYRGLSGKHPPTIVVAALRMTIASMLTRSALDDSAKRGRGGFQNYFQQELVSNVAVLIRGDKAANLPGTAPSASSSFSRNGAYIGQVI